MQDLETLSSKLGNLTTYIILKKPLKLDVGIFWDSQLGEPPMSEKNPQVILHPRAAMAEFTAVLQSEVA